MLVPDERGLESSQPLGQNRTIKLPPSIPAPQTIDRRKNKRFILPCAAPTNSYAETRGSLSDSIPSGDCLAAGRVTRMLKVEGPVTASRPRYFRSGSASRVDSACLSTMGPRASFSGLLAVRGRLPSVAQRFYRRQTTKRANRLRHRFWSAGTGARICYPECYKI